MPLRTSAALALVTTLLALPVSALACGWECGIPGAGPATVQAVDAVEGACHRAIEEAPAARHSLAASPHDCSAHAPLIATLSNTRLSAATAPAPSVTPALSSAQRLALNAVRAADGPRPPTDRSPGRTLDPTTPLRV